MLIPFRETRGEFRQDIRTAFGKHLKKLFFRSRKKLSAFGIEVVFW